MKVTLLRHAEVETNYHHKYNGHIDIALSEYGKLQALDVAQILKDEDFDAIYCSDLLRARQTLEAFETTLTPVFTKELREKSWGRHEGKSFQEIESSGIKYQNFEQWIHALDGENIHNYQANAVKYFQNTILKRDATNILVLTHGGFIRSLLAYYKNTSFEETFNIKINYATFLFFDEKSNSFNY